MLERSPLFAIIIIDVVYNNKLDVLLFMGKGRCAMRIILCLVEDVCRELQIYMIDISNDEMDTRIMLCESSTLMSIQFVEVTMRVIAQTGIRSWLNKMM